MNLSRTGLVPKMPALVHRKMKHHSRHAEIGSPRTLHGFITCRCATMQTIYYSALNIPNTHDSQQCTEINKELPLFPGITARFSSRRRAWRFRDSKCAQTGAVLPFALVRQSGPREGQRDRENRGEGEEGKNSRWDGWGQALKGRVRARANSGNTDRGSIEWR